MSIHSAAHLSIINVCIHPSIPLSIHSFIHSFIHSRVIRHPFIATPSGLRRSGAGVDGDAGLGSEPAGPHGHHQGHPGVQPREGPLDRAGRARRAPGQRGGGGVLGRAGVDGEASRCSVGADPRLLYAWLISSDLEVLHGISSFIFWIGIRLLCVATGLLSSTSHLCRRVPFCRFSCLPTLTIFRQQYDSMVFVA